MTTWRGRHLLAASVTAIALVAVLVGVYVAGSPADARLSRMDERRLDDLRMARQSLDFYWTRHGLLPPSLDSLPHPSGDSSRFRDPATGRSYSYRPSSDSAFDLCADFAKASPAEWHGVRDEVWQHAAGSQCFHLVASRQQYVGPD